MKFLKLMFFFSLLFFINCNHEKPLPKVRYYDASEKLNIYYELSPNYTMFGQEAARLVAKEISLHESDKAILQVIYKLQAITLDLVKGYANRPVVPWEYLSMIQNHYFPHSFANYNNTNWIELESSYSTHINTLPLNYQIDIRPLIENCNQESSKGKSQIRCDMNFEISLVIDNNGNKVTKVLGKFLFAKSIQDTEGVILK